MPKANRAQAQTNLERRRTSAGRKIKGFLDRHSDELTELANLSNGGLIFHTDYHGKSRLDWHVTFSMEPGSQKNLLRLCRFIQACERMENQDLESMLKHIFTLLPSVTEETNHDLG